jgi:hypothetical protein
MGSIVWDIAGKHIALRTDRELALGRGAPWSKHLQGIKRPISTISADHYGEGLAD